MASRKSKSSKEGARKAAAKPAAAGKPKAGRATKPAAAKTRGAEKRPGTVPNPAPSPSERAAPRPARREASTLPPSTSEATAGGRDAARPSHPTPELIARRAYQIFEARGRQPGHDVEDWLQAERELGRRP